MVQFLAEQLPLRMRGLSLFVMVVEEVLLQDPDLDRADFHILDFSIPKGEDERRLRIIRARLDSHFDDREKRAMLEVFADGYRLARDELARSTPAREMTTRSTA